MLIRNKKDEKNITEKNERQYEKQKMKKHGLGLTAINLITSDLPDSGFSAMRLFMLRADLHRITLPFNDSLGFVTIGFQCLGFCIVLLPRLNCILPRL